jgi:hypothetical protein
MLLEIKNNTYLEKVRSMILDDGTALEQYLIEHKQPSTVRHDCTEQFGYGRSMPTIQLVSTCLCTMYKKI